MKKQIAALALAVGAAAGSAGVIAFQAPSKPIAHAMDVRRADLPDGGARYTTTVYGSLLKGKARVDISGAPCLLSADEQKQVSAIMQGGAAACVAARE